MQLGSLFVKRPVMTSMVFLGLILFGLIAWLRLPQELFPNISVPQLLVITKYPNAAPEEIENLITKPIEEAVGKVNAGVASDDGPEGIWSGIVPIEISKREPVADERTRTENARLGAPADRR